MKYLPKITEALLCQFKTTKKKNIEVTCLNENKKKTCLHDIWICLHIRTYCAHNLFSCMPNMIKITYSGFGAQ